MLKIKLRRMGAPKKPSYRMVVADSRTSRGGAFLEIIGLYDPMTEPETVKVEVEKAKNWISKGAQPTDTVNRLLKKVGVL
ncbi:30S ribosomal protein S16 [Dehalogenimonas alkenigignens]|uniref:Small ribosomal subunit protein bS16 n=1 Tax=Dehalogenimonas alkenigignens TaxID=1217799 RepID=A0A0W0GJ96_9CHLR|nr:30S ribosomal protein S16 [Dehalogenimonas alkenigignens]KTB48628.1 SSU ribosomal protein S16P [Dehalogenimonas alkenigignens]PVV84937.1 30S ribosomal protein S16 [Dehalogenimonas alkenigignens]